MVDTCYFQHLQNLESNKDMRLRTQAEKYAVDLVTLKPLTISRRVQLLMSRTKDSIESETQNLNWTRTFFWITIGTNTVVPQLTIIIGSTKTVIN
jgi:hypothetical protein